MTSLAWSIVLIGDCNANTTGRSGRDLTCDCPFKGQPLLAIQHTANAVLANTQQTNEKANQNKDTHQLK